MPHVSLQTDSTVYKTNPRHVEDSIEDFNLEAVTILKEEWVWSMTLWPMIFSLVGILTETLCTDMIALCPSCVSAGCISVHYWW